MLSVKGFLMFFSTAKGSFTLSHTMLPRGATHKAVFIHACTRVGAFVSVSFPFHYNNIPQERHFVKGCEHFVNNFLRVSWHKSCRTPHAKLPQKLTHKTY